MLNTLNTVAIVFAILLTLLPGSASAGNGPTICDNATAIPFGAANTVVVAGAQAGQKVYVCGVTASGTVNTNTTVQLVYGTKTTTDCDTGQSNLTPVYSSGSPVVGTSEETIIPVQQPAFIWTPASQQLCVKAAGTIGTLRVKVYWAQHA